MSKILLKLIKDEISACDCKSIISKQLLFYTTDSSFVEDTKVDLKARKTKLVYDGLMKLIDETEAL